MGAQSRVMAVSSIWSRLSRPTEPIVILVSMFLLVLPLFLDQYWLHLVIYSLWITVLTASWSIPASAGQFSLAHTLYLGCGAYVPSVLFLTTGLSPWLGAIAGVAIACLLALAIANSTLRMEIPFLAYAVLSLALVQVGVLIVRAVPMLHGDMGLNIPFRESNPSFLAAGKAPYFYIILMVAGIVTLVSRYVLTSKMGYYLRALKQNTRVAKSVGVNVTKYHSLALVLSAAIWAFAGTFWAQYSGFVAPGTTLNVQIVITVVIAATVGGVGTLWGPIVVPFLLTLVVEFVRGEIGSQIPGIGPIIYGVIIVVMLLWLKMGIFNWIERRRRVGKAL